MPKLKWKATMSPPGPHEWDLNPRIGSQAKPRLAEYQTPRHPPLPRYPESRKRPHNNQRTPHLSAFPHSLPHPMNSLPQLRTLQLTPSAHPLPPPTTFHVSTSPLRRPTRNSPSPPRSLALSQRTFRLSTPSLRCQPSSHHPTPSSLPHPRRIPIRPSSPRNLPATLQRRRLSSRDTTSC